MKKLRRYLWNILLAFDQLFNAILGGDPDETLSSRFGKWLLLPKKTWRYKIAYLVCRMLHLLDRHHCEESIDPTEGKDAVIK